MHFTNGGKNVHFVTTFNTTLITTVFVNTETVVKVHILFLKHCLFGN